MSDDLPAETTRRRASLQPDNHSAKKEAPSRLSMGPNSRIPATSGKKKKSAAAGGAGGGAAFGSRPPAGAEEAERRRRAGREAMAHKRAAAFGVDRRTESAAALRARLEEQENEHREALAEIQEKFDQIKESTASKTKELEAALAAERAAAAAAARAHAADARRLALALEEQGVDSISLEAFDANEAAAEEEGAALDALLAAAEADLTAAEEGEAELLLFLQRIEVQC